ncbi:hypothetical protein AC249_AIPGENE5093, partial [Exaiptasia diaphana]
MGAWTETMEYSAVDQHFNPLANQGITVFSDGYWAGYVDIPYGDAGQTVSCWVPDEPALLTVFDARLSESGFPDQCTSLAPRIGECGKTLQTIETNTDGKASFGVIPGSSWVQYNAGVRPALEADEACEELLENGDAHADFQQVCAHLYAETEESPTLKQEEYFYSFLVVVESTYDPQSTPDNPCNFLADSLVTAEGIDAYTAVLPNQQLRDPVTLSAYELRGVDCSAVGKPYCPFLPDNPYGEPQPNCSCSHPPSGEGSFCEPCRLIWDGCRPGADMPDPECLFGREIVFRDGIEEMVNLRL